MEIKPIVTTSQISSSEDRAGAAENPPNKAGGKSEESKKKNNNKNSNNTNKRTFYVRSHQDDVMKGVVILSLVTATNMTTDYKLMLVGLSLYVSAKGYKKWQVSLRTKCVLKRRFGCDCAR